MEHEFNLQKVKITKKGVELTWNSGETIFSIINKTPAHPDFTGAINSLRPLFRAVFGFKDSAFALTGVSFKGEDEKLGVNITGRFLADSGHEIGLSTHRIMFADDFYGEEHKIDDVKEKLEIEAYKYIYEGKSSQEMLDFESEEEQEEAVEHETENV